LGRLGHTLIIDRYPGNKKETPSGISFLLTTCIVELDINVIYVTNDVKMADCFDLD